MYYDKKLRYLDYLENGERIRNAGFVKIEVTDQLCNIQVQVTGLHSSDNSTREVKLQGEELQEGILGTIAFQAGRGSLIRKRMPADDLCNGIGYEELTALKINLGKSRELVCRWKEKGGKKSEPELKMQPEPRLVEWQKGQPELQPELRSEPQPKMQPEPQPELQPKDQLQTQSHKVLSEDMEFSEGREFPDEPGPSDIGERFPGEEGQPDASQRELQEGQPDASQRETQERQPKTSTQELMQEPPQPPSGPAMPPSLSEDKWKQLSAIYPHIAPFHDERDYLSIGPGDFVVLSRKYYRLVTNSFLLHGFYNYGHMVLARTVKKGEEQFYLGVPGNFYERERQVAIMFGFESFECKTEPVQTGDYGYFMIRVEL